MRLLLWLLHLAGFTLVPEAEWIRVQKLMALVDDEKLATAKANAATIVFVSGGKVDRINAIMAKVEAFPSIEEITRTRQIAEEAHIAACAGLPVTAVAATKIGGEVVISGMSDFPDPKQFMNKTQED